MIGKTILGYHVDEKIGSGGFGTVYKVSKTNAAGTYTRALKHITLPTKKQYASVLNSMGGDYSKADDYFAGILKDIVSEIKILSTLSESGTQNIVRYYENDIIETPSPKTYDIYILMEYLIPFPDYTENHLFTIRDVIHLGKDILTALIDCHDKNIIHRDIKDDNIFVSNDGVFKLGDFGVSKALKDKSRAESVKGTPNFIAPEVYLGKEKYDSTVDIYSLGIVLYKLLNKSRNPFLPTYPAPYNSQDEDTAFEARMTGKVPERPICAKNSLGDVVLKAIMPRSERYNSAKEFYTALDSIEKQLGEAELSLDLGLSIPADLNKSFTPAAQTMGNSIHNNETIGSDTVRTADTTVDSESDRHLFDTIGSQTHKQTATGTPSPKPKTSFEGSSGYSYENPAWDTNIPSSPPKVEAISKKDFKWLLYLSPALIAALWLIVYLIIIPITYGKAVSFIEWIIADPTAIIDALKDSSNVLTPIYKIILLKVFNYATLIALITSLFFVGRSIQKKKPATNSNAKLVGKEPYTITIGLLEEIKMIRENDTTVARKAVSLLNERLKNESAFGEGSDTVINCENEIASYLKAIEGLIPGLHDINTIDETTRNIETLCQRCMAKLKVRIELKKK